MSVRDGWGAVQEIRTLRESFGEQVVLLDEQDESVAYRILAEFRHEGNDYAVLQSEQLKKEQEVALFKIAVSGDGEPELETIEDDDEWETVAELYDELSFPLQKGP